MKYLSPSYLQLFSQFFDPESAQETEIYIDFNLLSYRSFHFLASGMLYHTAADITCPHWYLLQNARVCQAMLEVGIPCLFLSI